MPSLTLDGLLRWLTEHGGPEGVDLSGADLSGLEAGPAALAAERAKEPADEPPCWLVPETGGLNLAGANLASARFDGAYLPRASFARADLTGAVLHACRLEGADLHQACLEQANLYQADLREADLHGCCLVQAELSETTLVGAKLAGAALEGAALRGADARGAILTGSCLDRADLSQADLRGAVLRDSALSHARLEETDLRGANLGSCNLAQAGLRDADLRGASLHEAKVAGADLRGANLEGANLSGVDLLQAVRTDAEAPPSPAPEYPQTLDAEGVSLVRVDLGRGHLEVLGGEAEARLTTRGIPQDELEVRRSGEALELRWVGPVGTNQGPVGEALRLALPATVRRLEARVAMGELRARGLDATGRLETGIGGVMVSDSRFEGEATAKVGNLAFERVDGGLEARTGAGNVTLIDHRGGPVTIHTGAGNVVLRGGRYDALDLHAGAGGIEVSPEVLTADTRLHAGAGGITVELPGSAAAQVEAVAGMGLVSADWPLVRVGRPGPSTSSSSRMVGAFGEESERIRLELRTGVGDIHLRRRADPPAAAPTEPAAEPEGHLAVLESLSRGELTVEEAEALLFDEADR